MTAAPGVLIAVALGAIALLVVLVTRVKLNPFIALLIAALVVGAGARMPMLSATKAFSEGLGATLGGIAAVIALGAMLGKLLAESGGAEVLARRFNAFFGPERAVWCIAALGIVVGLATWFVVGLLLLLPILLTLTRESRKPFLALAIPLVSFLSVMHGLTPPHPGPVVAIDKLHANMGAVLMWAFIVGLPAAWLAGPVFARFAARHERAEAPPMPESAARAGIAPPPFGLTLFTILLPVLLMLVATFVELLHVQKSALGAAGMFVGNPTIALLISVLFASWSLGVKCGYRLPQLLAFTEQCVGGIGMALLVVGGGGGFARVLRDAGVAAALGQAATDAHLPLMVYAWLVAAFIRVATGSATVAITVAADLLAPLMQQQTGGNVELLIVAIGCGSLVLSHLNDGGFWVVKECLGLDIGQMFRTWTVVETIIGVAGFAFALGIQALLRAA